jgi:hypothetical protein
LSAQHSLPEPSGILRPIGKETQGDDAEQHGGNPLDTAILRTGMTI